MKGAVVVMVLIVILGFVYMNFRGQFTQHSATTGRELEKTSGAEKASQTSSEKKLGTTITPARDLTSGLNNPKCSSGTK